MKKLPLIIAACLLVMAVQSQTTGEKKGWPSIERYAFISECIKEAKVGMSEDSARFYCYCMQEVVELKYPTVEEAAKITEEDIRSEAWQKDVITCLGGTWTSELRETFLSSCREEAEKNVTDKSVSKYYCECMLYKVEKAYPDPAEAAKLTEELFSTPKWKKIITDCAAF